MRKSKFRKSHLRKSQHLLAPKLLNLPTKEYKKFPLGLPRAVYADSVQSKLPFSTKAWVKLSSAPRSLSARPYSIYSLKNS